MPITRLEKLGSIGLILDQHEFELPPSALSKAHNVECIDGSLEISKGWELEANTLQEVSYIIPTVYLGEPYWVLCGNTSLFAFNNTSFKTLRTGLTTPIIWDGTTINGAVILTNGIDPPQYWFPGGDPPTALPSFDVGEDFESATAITLTSFKRHLVMANINDGGVEPYTVWWSHPADPNSVPGDWDYTSATSDAGRAYLPEEGGEILALRNLRDQVIIYRQNATHSMSYIGGQFIFQFRTLFSRVGLLAPRAVAEIEGQHLFVSQGDIYIHDGTNLKSVGEDRIKKFFFSSVTGDPTALLRVHIVPDFDRQEAWICYPTEGQDYCSQALVWRWTDDTWTSRDLPDARHSAYGVYSSPSSGGDPDDSWDDGPDETWDDGPDIPWDFRTFAPGKKAVMTAGPVGKVYWMNTGNLQAGTAYTANVERAGLNLSDDETVTSIRHVYPRVFTSGPISFWFGGQDHASAPVRWEGPFQFDPDEQYRISCRVSGRRHSWRVEVPSTTAFRLEALDFDHVKVGER